MLCYVILYYNSASLETCQGRALWAAPFAFWPRGRDRAAQLRC